MMWNRWLRTVPGGDSTDGSYMAAGHPDAFTPPATALRALSYVKPFSRIRNAMLKVTLRERPWLQCTYTLPRRSASRMSTACSSSTAGVKPALRSSAANWQRRARAISEQFET